MIDDTHTTTTTDDRATTDASTDDYVHGVPDGTPLGRRGLLTAVGCGVVIWQVGKAPGRTGR